MSTIDNPEDGFSEEGFLVSISSARDGTTRVYEVSATDGTFIDPRYDAYRLGRTERERLHRDEWNVLWAAEVAMLGLVPTSPEDDQ